jgi:hypothetical protein
MSTFQSSALRLMPPQFNERVGKWTHEPRSNLHHKKHLSNTFICTFIFSTKLFRKCKNIFTSLHTQLKPKNIITASYLLYCILIYFTVLRIILLLLTFTPCAWEPLSGVGDTRTRNCFTGCWKKNDMSYFDCSPRVRYQPQVSLLGKIYSCYDTLHLESQLGTLA